MKENLLSELEREKAIEQLKFAINYTIEHDSEDPYTDYETGRYDGDMEPILVAITQAFRHAFMLVLANLTEEEKAKILERHEKEIK